ncbi:ABC transporter substrate-binding protein [Bifidobacterium amazonense]|uniref:ABC transporter substrate-binding protein n=1 Tax=Bifidobacterium amazonense TaxID=2809027 RepID=A0ABS9VYQ1_9BIFI|nr:ABC transporter substrate-binding protein [Bifidobacterium amazonense]MCH9277230.1 ABC transporter substrate-binding protein [Bifidobacterium amazonense]
MHRQKKTALRSWLVFVATTVILSLVAWLGWSWAQGTITLPRATPSNLSTASVTVGLTDAPQSLDIRTDASANVERALLGNVYETLVSRDDNNQIVAGVAKSWTVSSDGLTYDFTLHRGMTFANGHKLDSADVVWSMQQIVKNKYQGATALSGLASVANPSPTKVTLTLSKPDPTLLRALSGRAGIVYDSEWNGDYATQTAGSGPLEVTAFDKGGSVTLSRNDRYWGDPSGAQTVTLKYYANDDALAKAALNGDVNAFFTPDAAAVKQLDGQSSWQVESGTSTTKVMLALNNDTNSIFSDAQARQIVRYAVDAKTIAASASDSAGELGGPIGPLEEGYEDLTGLFPFDQVKAAQMIAFFATGAAYFGTVELVVPTAYQSLGETVAGYLRSVGIDTNVQAADAATVAQRVKDGQYTMALLAGDADAAEFGTSDNVFRYTNGTVQDAYKSAMAATNDADYQSRMKTFAKTVSQDAAADWLYSRKTFAAAAKGVTGLPKNMTDDYLPLAKATVK